MSDFSKFEAFNVKLNEWCATHFPESTVTALKVNDNVLAKYQTDSHDLLFKRAVVVQPIQQAQSDVEDGEMIDIE